MRRSQHSACLASSLVIAKVNKMLYRGTVEVGRANIKTPALRAMTSIIEAVHAGSTENRRDGHENRPNVGGGGEYQLQGPVRRNMSYKGSCKHATQESLRQHVGRAYVNGKGGACVV